MDPRELLLAFDAGTSSVRAQLLRLPASPEELPAESGPLIRVPYSSQPDPQELDPDLWLGCVEMALVEAAAGAAPALLAGVTFFHGLLGLDEEGRPLTPLYTWADTHSGVAASRLASILDPLAYHQQTGCFLHPCFPLARLARLTQEHPGLWPLVDRWVSPAGWLHRAWTASPSVTHAIAAGSGLYDLGRQDWLDGQILRAVGVARERLEDLLPPDCSWLPVPSAAVKGRGRPPASVRWLLPVFPDAVASNLGAGCSRPDRFALNLGTSGALRAIVGEPLPSPIPDKLFCYRIDGKRALLGGAVSNCGSLIEWLARVLRLEPWPRSYANLAAAVATERTPLPSAAPDLAGQRSPHWPAAASGTWEGLRLETTPEAMALAMLDAVADQFGELAAALIGAIGRPRRVVAGGGGTADPSWVARLAEAMELPIEIAPCRETTLLGVAVHAASHSRQVSYP